MKQLLLSYLDISDKMSYLKSAFLLAVRLFWGWQFMQTGWGKMHNIPRVTGYFTTLNIPFPGITAHFIAGLEFFGGLLLILGLFSRLTGLLLSTNMLVAYWTAAHEELFSVFSDPGKFYGADPYPFLFASAIVLVFGAVLISLDSLLERYLKRGAAASHWQLREA